MGMNTATKVSALALATFLSVPGCAATTHATTPAIVGTARPSSSLETVVDQPGPLTVETFISATWQVDREGLINLDDPKAKAAHLVDGPEPIDLFIHVIHHPEQGLYLVDSGVER